MSHKIIIVGASSGLGFDAAEIFAQEGWRVGVLARRIEPLEMLKNKYPDNIQCAKIDVSHNEAGELLCNFISDFGGMDCYFHVAGICHENPELDVVKECLTDSTNVEGFTRMIATAFNYFREKGVKGQIAAITSVAGTKGLGDLAAYSASKRYQSTYLQAIEQIAKRENLPIKFTEIRPGWTRTPLIDSSRKYLMSMEARKVAHAAVKAIISKKRIAVIDWRWAIMTFLWRLLPSWLWVRLPIRSSK